MVMIIPASVTSPRKMELMAAINKISTSGFRKRPRNSTTAERRLGGAGSLGPYCSSSAAACSDVSPFSGIGDLTGAATGWSRTLMHPPYLANVCWPRFVISRSILFWTA